MSPPIRIVTLIGRGDFTVKPGPSRTLVDRDAAGTRENLLHIVAIKKRMPDFIIVPAHAMRAMAELPRLPAPRTPQTSPPG